jgi:carbamoyl-phosphate synthase large subunit
VSVPRKRIALSGINASDNPGPGVPLARSLREAFPDCEIIGLTYDAHDSGNYMDFLFQNTYRLPFPSKGWNALFKRILEIHKKSPIDIIVPSLDAELPLYILHQQDLLKHGISTFLPTEAQFQMRSKDQLSEVCKKLNLLYPKTFSVNSIDELMDVLREKITFPCMIKGNFYKAYLVHNTDDAILRFAEISAEWGCPILVQQYVAGNEINLIGLGDGKGGACGMVTIKKLTTTHLGKIWTGVTITHPALMEHGSDFIKKTMWRGPFELECIEQDGTIYLIEINPRFPAWVYFATAVGINLPKRLIELITSGRCETTSEYEAGKLFVRYSFEIVTDLTKYSQLIMDGVNQ